MTENYFDYIDFNKKDDIIYFNKIYNFFMNSIIEITNNLTKKKRNLLSNCMCKVSLK